MKPNINITQHELNKQQLPYFQTQSQNQLTCGLHALNNLLGGISFSIENLQSISQQLNKSHDIINPHKHCCKCINGDYSSQVLVTALRVSGYQTESVNNINIITFSKQKLSSKSTVGFLLSINKNESCFKSLLSKLFCQSSRHWCSIRKFKQKFYILDSLFDEPLGFDTMQQLINFITLQLNKNAEIILVKRQANSKIAS